MSAPGATMGFSQKDRQHCKLLRWLILGLIFAAGFGIRAYDLYDPPLDFHASRQLRSLIITRSAYYHFLPGADAAVRQKAEDLGRLEMYEPPILETITGLLQVATGFDPIAIARLLNATFWAVGGWLIYRIANRTTTAAAGLVGILFHFFLPFSVIASRSFQPDPWMVMWILFAVWSVLRWSEQATWGWAVSAGLLGGIAILVKGMAAFYIAAIFIAMVLARLKISALKNLQVWTMAALALLPLLGYYLLFEPQRTQDFFSFWTVSLSGLILTTNFYADWLSMLKGLMGLTTLVVALTGLLLAEKSFKTVLIGGWLGYGMLGLVFPYQYSTHEYYHLPLVPLVALSLVPLAHVVIRQMSNQRIIWRAGLVLTLFLAAFYGLYVSRSILYAADYSLEPASWARVGKALPEGSRFVALTADYGMRLNYYGWRSPTRQWPSTADLRLFSLGGSDPLQYEELFQEITSGNDYFLVTAYSELDAQPQLKDLLYNTHPVTIEGNGYTIFDLNKTLK